MRQLTPSDWSVPSELDGWISDINEEDQGSTFFHYPDPKNQRNDIKKSSVQEVNSSDIFSNAKDGGTPMKIFMAIDDDDNVTNIYQAVGDPMKDIATTLKDAANLLYSAHYGLMMELVYGAF